MAPPRTPDDPLDWRPQEPLVTRVAVTIRDPIVEPLWSGTRVLVHVDTRGDAEGHGPTVRVIERSGLELTIEEPGLAASLGAAVLARDVVMDGILTTQATRGTAGMAIVPEARLSVMDTMFSRNPGIEIRRPGTGDVLPEEAFVAVDLLRVDGQSLLDVPLLERKRLLESVIEQGPLVRVSVFCRPPVDPWVASWQSAGLRGAMMKSANGRYIPGDRTPEWRTLTRVAARR
jgi:bifunctional non-homologous end joining protein LigD